MITQTRPDQHWFLNSVTGWGNAALTDLTSSDAGLTLDALPGQATPGKPAIEDDICCAGALACNECGELHILDVETGYISRVENRILLRCIEEIGGPGADRRQFNHPRGLAMRGGMFLVSDTGNNRVQVFTPAPYALVQVWDQSNGAGGRDTPGFDKPWGIAVGRCRNTFVVDRGNRRVQKFSPDGKWQANIGVGVLTDPTEIAVGPNGVVAVVDRAFSPTGGRIVIFSPTAPHSPQIIAALQVTANLADPNNPKIEPLPEIPDAESGKALPATIRPLKACAVAFDNKATLYIAAATGVVHRFDPDSTLPFQYDFIGAGFTGQGAAVHLAWQKPLGLLAIIPDAKTNFRGLWQIPTAGSFVMEGLILSNVLDGGAEDCVWDRITLSAIIPFGTSIQVDYFTSTDGSQKSLTTSNSNGSYLFVSDEPDPDSTPTPPDPGLKDRTCLVNTDIGQYLQFRLTFRSNSHATPTVNSVSVYFPRESYLQYLPAVFQEDPVARDFLDRFLANFKETVDGFDQTIDDIVGLLDPNSVRENFFPWLAAWINFQADPRLPIATQRKLLKNAVKTYRTRGTISGIKQAIMDSLELLDDPQLSAEENKAVRKTMTIGVIEHFKLREWPVLRGASSLGNAEERPVRLWSRDFYQRLQVGNYSQVGNFLLTDTPIPAAEAPAWGAHEFSLYFYADPLRVDFVQQKIADIVEAEKPAHTKANVVPVFPRFRIGVQLTLGVDSRVGVCTPLVLGIVSRLGYDAILAPSPALRDMQKLGTSPQPKIGVNTRLF